jgi:putative N6-adenine-specific DNA methylase
MTDFATRNAERAGVAHAIDFKTADALQRMAPADRGTIVMNPPYGERIDAKGRGSHAAEAPRTLAAPRAPDRPRGPGADAFARENPEAVRRGARDAPQPRGGRESAIVEGDGANGAGEFFAQLATHWKRNYSGWTAWVLSPDMKLPTAMRLKESRRVPMWNGPIECRLFRFDMVSGSARDKASTPQGTEP